MAQKSYIVKSIFLALGLSSAGVAGEPAKTSSDKEVWYNAKGEPILVRDSNGKVTKPEEVVPTRLVREGAVTQNGNTMQWKRGRRYRGGSHYYSPYLGSPVYYPYRSGGVYYSPSCRSRGFYGGYYNGKFHLNYRSKGFSIYGSF